MSNSEVGSGQIAFVPTFKGFRAATEKEVDGTASSSAASFKSIFGKGAAAAGAAGGKSFKSSFQSSSKDLIAAATAEVGKASRDLATVRGKELDVTGRVRVAEAQLAEARTKYADGSSQVIRAEERAAQAARVLLSAQDAVKSSTDRLAAAKRGLASASSEAAVTSGGFRSAISSLPSLFNRAGADSARSFGSGFGGGLGTIAAGSFLGISVAGLARGAGELIGTGIRESFQSVGLASDLSETTSAVTQVYGDASADIISFASDANQKLGQTRTQALKAAQTFGVFAKQAGLTGKPLANFSTGLVTLSTDLSSFYNTSTDEAIEAIGAGLRGEAEPLRRFGVLLDDATLRAKALELGIYEGNDALTGQQRILAAQAVIFDQTGIAQGDFARTSGDLAGQQKVLQASLDDTQTKFGEALLPAFSSAATFANDTLLPRLSDLIDVAGPKLAQALDDAGPSFEKLADKAVPLLDKLTDMGVKALPDVLDRLNDLATAAPVAFDALDAISPYILGGAKSIDRMIADWSTKTIIELITPGQGKVNEAGFLVGDSFSKGLLKAKPGFYDAGLQSVQTFRDGFLVADPAATGSQIGVETSGGLLKAGPGFYQTGLTLGDSFVQGMAGRADEAANAGLLLGGAAEDAALDAVSSFKNLGGRTGSGFAAGIRDSASEVESAAADIADLAARTVAIKLQIKSPSRVGARLGGHFSEGLGEGIFDRSPLVSSAARAAAESAQDGWRSALASAALPASLSAVDGGSSLAASGLPQQIQLVDANGSILGLMDVRIRDYDRSSSETAARGVRGWE